MTTHSAPAARPCTTCRAGEVAAHTTAELRQNGATGLSVGSLAAFGQDNALHIYAVSLSGSVYRIVKR
jgi:hypothetical protein